MSVQGERSIVELVIHEGRNRIVRRLLDHVGHPVRRLTRTAIGPVQLQGLGTGELRDLTLDELGVLLDNAALIAVAGTPVQFGCVDGRRRRNRTGLPRKPLARTSRAAVPWGVRGAEPQEKSMRAAFTSPAVYQTKDVKVAHAHPGGPGAC